MAGGVKKIGVSELDTVDDNSLDISNLLELILEQLTLQTAILNSAFDLNIEPGDIEV